MNVLEIIGVVISLLVFLLLIALLLILIKAIKNPKSSLSNNEQMDRTELEKSFQAILETTTNQNDQIKTELRDLLEKSYSIPDIKNKVDNVDKLLNNNWKTGKAGEYMLERLLENISGILSDKNILATRQYKLQKKSNDNNSLIVDLFLKGSGGKYPNIAIDSKFSIDSFNTYLEKNDKDSKKNFENNISHRIKETAKYVSIEDNIPFAIMFIPSEAILAHISNNTDLIEKAFNENVILASPSTLFSIIHSIDSYMELFEKINKNKDEYELIKKIIETIKKNDEHFDKLDKEIDKINKTWKSIKREDYKLFELYNNLKKEIQKND